MAEQVVKIRFEVDGISGTVGSVEELQAALKGVEKQSEETAAAVEEVADAAADMGKETEEAGKAGEAGIKLLNEATGGLAGRFVEMGQSIKTLGKGLVTSFKSGVQGANAMGKALIATGIGAIVVAVGLLVAYWDDIKGLVSGVSSDQAKLLADTQATVAANQENLDATMASENTLKAQGMTEAEIRDLKIQQTNEVIAATEAQLEQQKELKKSQVAAAERNQKIAAGIIAFLTAPITLLLGAIDALTYGLQQVGVLEEATSLAEDFTMGTAKLIFDPEEVAEEGDAAIKETEKQLRTLKNQRDGYINDRREKNKAAAKEAADLQKELNAQLEDLRAQNIVDAEEEALALLEIERKRARAELVAKGANQELLLEFDKRYEQKRAEIIDQFQKEREAKAEEERQKALENRKTIDEALLQAGLDSIENTFRRAEEELRIEEEKQIEMLRLAGATDEEIQKIREQYTGKRKALAKEEAEYQAELEQQKKDAVLGTASAALGAIVELVGEGSVVGKAAAVAQTTIDTYQSATAAYKSVVGIPVVGPVLAPIAAATAAAAGLASIKKIIATKIPGKDGAGTAGAVAGSVVPQVPAFNPQAAIAANTAGATAPGQVSTQQVGTQSTVVRAYVVDSEITNQQEATRKIENLASL